jgi:hypothetical protein
VCKPGFGLRLDGSKFNGYVGVAATIPMLGTVATRNEAGSNCMETASFKDTALVLTEGVAPARSTEPSDGVIITLELLSEYGFG